MTYKNHFNLVSCEHSLKITFDFQPENHIKKKTQVEVFITFQKSMFKILLPNSHEVYFNAKLKLK